MIYFATFDVATTLRAYGTITIATAGKASIVVNMAAMTLATADAGATVSTFNHFWDGLGQTVGQDPASTVNLASSMPQISFGDQLRLLLRAAATTAAWASPTGIAVSVSATTGRYTISYVTQSITITLSTSYGEELLGIASGSVSALTGGTYVVLGTSTPRFVIVPTLDRTSLSTPNYEPQAIATQGVSATGHTFGMRRTVSPLYRDWIQQYETKEKTIRRSAASSHPSTFQELFEVDSCVYPFVVYDGFENSVAEVFVLREEGSSWGLSAVQRADDQANDAQFHITFKAIVIGGPSGDGGPS